LSFLASYLSFLALLLKRPEVDYAAGLAYIGKRIAPRLLARLRRLPAKESKPYQTLIHELLERAAKRDVA